MCCWHDGDARSHINYILTLSTLTLIIFFCPYVGGSFGFWRWIRFRVRRHEIEPDWWVRGNYIRTTRDLTPEARRRYHVILTFALTECRWQRRCSALPYGGGNYHFSYGTRSQTKYKEINSGVQHYIADFSHVNITILLFWDSHIQLWYSNIYMEVGGVCVFSLFDKSLPSAMHVFGLCFWHIGSMHKSLILSPHDIGVSAFRVWIRYPRDLRRFWCFVKHAISPIGYWLAMSHVWWMWQCGCSTGWLPPICSSNSMRTRISISCQCIAIVNVFLLLATQLCVRFRQMPNDSNDDNNNGQMPHAPHLSDQNCAHCFDGNWI